MSKYSIANATIAAAKAQAEQSGIDAGDAIEALIVMAIQESVALRGPTLTRQSLTYELSNVRGDVDFDFVRSR